MTAIQSINVKSATVVAGGSGGSNGTQTVTSVGGVLKAGGAPASHSVTVSGGAITAYISLLNSGGYSRPPANPVQVTGAGLVGATLAHQYDGNGSDEFLL